MRLLLTLAAVLALVAGPLNAQCVNGRCYSGGCPQPSATWATVQPQPVAAIEPPATWADVPEHEKEAFRSARERVVKGETVVVCTGPYGSLNSVNMTHGVPGLKRGVLYKCHLIDGKPMCELIAYDDPAVIWNLQTGPQTLTTGGENRFPLTPTLCPGGVCPTCPVTSR